MKFASEISQKNTIRFGEILVGKDFRMLGSAKVFRRTKGRFAAPVANLGAHIDGYGSTGFPFDLNLLVTPVQSTQRKTPRNEIN